MQHDQVKVPNLDEAETDSLAESEDKSPTKSNHKKWNRYVIYREVNLSNIVLLTHWLRPKNIEIIFMQQLIF